ncbi:MAG: hypothetical protein ACLRIS_02840 [Flavonifractor plautii]
MEEALRRLRADDYLNCYVFVLRENEGPPASTPGTALPGTGRRSTFPSPTT